MVSLLTVVSTSGDEWHAGSTDCCPLVGLWDRWCGLVEPLECPTPCELVPCQGQFFGSFDHMGLIGGCGIWA